MFSIYNILTVARFEMKTLFRSWFFRIFTFLALGILTILNIGFFTSVGNPQWALRGIPASIPYLNILMLNIIQAVIGVFLASDFLKRDKKLDTTEVVYMRSMTNTDYVLGKTTGILTIFMALNVAVLLLAGIFNFFFADVPVRIAAYLFYPLLLSVPTLVFIFGLSFFSMVTIRNQAVTFILLLGYIALTLFFLGQRFFYLFDYMGFHVPMMFSDFTGFGNLTGLILQRSIYLFMGLAFVFATILLLKRLPQQVATQRLALVLCILFGGGALALGINHIASIFAGRNYRQKIVEINNNHYNDPLVSPVSYDIDVTHNGATIDATAKILVKNENAVPLSEYQMRLNPGFAIQEVSGSEAIAYERNEHLLTIRPGSPLGPGEEDAITIHYAGSIREDACYLNVDNEVREAKYNIWSFKIDKRHAFINPNFVLLTPETMWYPMPGAGFSTEHPEAQSIYFSEFALNIKTNPTLTALSQGKSAEAAPGSGGVHFTNATPLPFVSLIIGDYTTESIQVDSINYELTTRKGHDFYKPYMNAIGDTISTLIRELKLDYEAKLGLTYPYTRLALVEVPIQFYAYSRPWTLAYETVQPEMVLMPENSVLLTGADFKQQERWEKRRMRRSNQVTTETETQARRFRNFVNSSLISEDMFARFRRGGMNNNLFPDVADRYLIFPNYYSFVHNIHSDLYPLINVALESFVNQSSEDPRAQMMRGFVGLSATEKTSLALEADNLEGLLRNPTNKEILKDAIRSKGDYLFSLLKSKVNVEDFPIFLAELLEEYRYKRLGLDEFVAEIERRTGVDFGPEIQKWYESRTLPAFLITEAEGYKILDGNRERYQLKFNIYNPNEVEGLLKITFRMGGGGQGGRGGSRGGMMGFGDPGVERIIYMDAKQGKQVGVVLDGFPRMMMINTMIAKNLPANINQGFEEFELRRGAVPFDGEIILDHFEPTPLPGEIIVDNEDPGFKAYNPESTSFLKRILNIGANEEEERYSVMRFWRPPTKWVASANDGFYGKFVRSAHFTRAGDGERKVSWIAEIPEPGNYEIYTHIYIQRHRGRGGRDGRRGASEKYQYKIFHDDGIEETVLDMENAEEGWNFLGSYYLSPDSARVELTNESPGRMVVADAIKWVRR